MISCFGMVRAGVLVLGVMLDLGCGGSGWLSMFSALQLALLREGYRLDIWCRSPRKRHASPHLSLTATGGMVDGVKLGPDQLMLHVVISDTTSLAMRG